MEITVGIEGLQCEHCVNRVKNALTEISAITKVEIDLANKKATIVASENISDATIKEKIEDAGYEVTSIH